MIRRRWLTIGQVASLLRSAGCMQSRRHARALIERCDPRMRCYKAHPPMWEDEVAAGQRWFARIRPSTRRTHALAGGRWNGNGLMGGVNGEVHG